MKAVRLEGFFHNLAFPSHSEFAITKRQSLLAGPFQNLQDSKARPWNFFVRFPRSVRGTKCTISCWIFSRLGSDLKHGPAPVPLHFQTLLHDVETQAQTAWPRRRDNASDRRKTGLREMWRRFRRVAPYLWPRGRPLLQCFVITSFLILALIRFISVLIPIFYKQIGE